MPRLPSWQALRGEDDAIGPRKHAYTSTTVEPMRTRPRADDRSYMKSTRYNILTSEENTWLKHLSPLGLLLTTLVSTSVLVGLVREWKITGQTCHAITSSRATTQFIVSIIGNFLGGIFVAVFCQLVNRATRLKLSRPVSLDLLAFWHALSTKSLDWHLPPSFLLFLVVFYLASAWAGPLWTGTLTPIPTTHNWTQSIPLDIPRYTDHSYDLWSQSILTEAKANATVSNKKGQFSYLPLQDRLGYLLTDGSVASSVDWRPAEHTKNDNSNFTYIGRSYGVGSSVGLADDAIVKKGTVAYAYAEHGYYTSVECIRNASSGFKLHLLRPGDDEPYWTIPAIFLATGPGPNTTESPSFANGNYTDYGGVVTVGLGGSDDIVAAAWWASFESGLAGNGLPDATDYTGKTRPVGSPAYTSIAAGKQNQNLNNVQCGIWMTPALFSIDVDVSKRFIQAKLQSKTSQPDVEPTGFIADSASSVLGAMTNVDTSLFTSIMGTMLNRNIDNVRQQKNLTTTTEECILQGVAETLEALIDDYLLAIGSAQLLVASDTSPVHPHVVSTAFNVGQKTYIIATFFVNAIMVFLYVAEAIRTRLWDQLPEFNYADVKAVVAASSLGGVRIGEKVQTETQLGRKSDRTAGRVKIVLSEDAGPILRLACHEEEEGGGTSSMPLNDLSSEMDDGYGVVDEGTAGQPVEDLTRSGGHVEARELHL